MNSRAHRARALFPSRWLETGLVSTFLPSDMDTWRLDGRRHLDGRRRLNRRGFSPGSPCQPERPSTDGNQLSFQPFDFHFAASGSATWRKRAVTNSRPVASERASMDSRYAETWMVGWLENSLVSNHLEGLREARPLLLLCHCTLESTTVTSGFWKNE